MVSAASIMRMIQKMVYIKIAISASTTPSIKYTQASCTFLRLKVHNIFFQDAQHYLASHSLLGNASGPHHD